MSTMDLSLKFNIPPPFMLYKEARILILQLRISVELIESYLYRHPLVLEFSDIDRIRYGCGAHFIGKMNSTVGEFKISHTAEEVDSRTKKTVPYWSTARSCRLIMDRLLSSKVANVISGCTYAATFRTTWLICKEVYFNSQQIQKALHDELQEKEFLIQPFDLYSAIHLLLKHSKTIDWYEVLPCQVCCFFFMVYKLFCIDLQLSSKPKCWLSCLKYESKLQMPQFWALLRQVNMSALDYLFSSELDNSQQWEIVAPSPYFLPRDILSTISSYDTFHGDLTQLEKRLDCIFNTESLAIHEVFKSQKRRKLI